MELAFPETSEPTLASLEECEHNMPVFESLDVVPKGLEPSSEPQECECNAPMPESLDAVPKGLEPSSAHSIKLPARIHELYYDQVCPMVEPPATAAKSVSEQEAETVPRSDGVAGSAQTAKVGKAV